MTPIDFAAFLAVVVALVGAVFFVCGRLWERNGTPAGVLADHEALADAMVDWVREVADDDPPAALPLALVAPLGPLPSRPAPVPPPGPVRSYSALAAWQLEQETSQCADTSVTKLAASIVQGMLCREQIDTRGAEILARTHLALLGDQAA